MQFRTTLYGSGTNTTGIPLTAEQVASLGAGKRPPVVVMINGQYTYRSTVGTFEGGPMISVSAANRAAAGIAAGDEIDVTLELDTAPRTVELPEDLAAALAATPAAGTFFATISPSNQRWHVEQVTGAKTPETRARRIAKSVELLNAGKAR